MPGDERPDQAALEGERFVIAVGRLPQANETRPRQVFQQRRHVVVGEINGGPGEVDRVRAKVGIVIGVAHRSPPA